MKKTISLILIICLVTGLLSGCSFKRISAEEDIIYMQMAGYLYTSQTRAQEKDEREMLKEREKAVDAMIGYMEKTAKNAFNLNGGFDKYESNLRTYMNKINESDSTDTSIIASILEKIIAYKVLLQSYEEEIRQYMKMKPGTVAAKSMIDTYMIDAICKLLDTQNEYTSWLIDNTSVAGAILSKENERQGSNLVSSSVSLYNKQIKGDLIDALENYNIAATINSYIVSADYYSSMVYFERAAETIETIKSGKSASDVSDEEIADLEAILKDAENSITKPPLLIPLPEKKASFSFARKVQAESNNDFGFYIIMEFMEMATFAKAWEKLQQNSSEQVPEEPAIEKRIEEKIEEIRQTPEKAINTVEIKPIPITQKSKAAGFFSGLMESGSQLVSDGVDKATDFFLGGIIEAAQNQIKKNENGITSQYAAIINKLSEYIAKGENINKTKQTDAVSNLLKNDLANLLGGNKATFVNMILYSTSEELIDTFGVWKENLKDGDKHIYTINDLIDLLGIMGIEVTDVPVKIPDKPSITPTSNTAVPTPTAAPEPVEPNIPTDSTEITDNYGISHITGFWQTIRELNTSLDNSSILYTIYGWTDLLDYDQYEKKEILDKDGNVSRIQYMDANSHIVGWETRFYDESIEYSYHFPNDNNHYFEIIRKGTVEKNYLYQVSTEDKTISRMTSVRFNESGHPENEENIKIIVQRENGKYDGLNLTSYNSNPTYAIYDMEEMWESYTFKNTILIREMQSSHKGSDIESIIKEYYDSGKIKREYTTLNGKENGLYTFYYENGQVQTYSNYKNGQYDGIVETFYDDGHTDDLTTYSDGDKDGIAYGYYPEEPHYLRYESEYVNGLENGIFKSYSVKGSLNMEIEYRDGTPDGIYRDYVIDDEIHTSSYHVFGQNENGKRVGIWEFGRNNVDWIERVYYEDGIKIWSEYADSANRSYYDKNGNVIRTEPKP